MTANTFLIVSTLQSLFILFSIISLTLDIVNLYYLEINMHKVESNSCWNLINSFFSASNSLSLIVFCNLSSSSYFYFMSSLCFKSCSYSCCLAFCSIISFSFLTLSVSNLYSSRIFFYLSFSSSILFCLSASYCLIFSSFSSLSFSSNFYLSSSSCLLLS